MYLLGFLLIAPMWNRNGLRLFSLSIGRIILLIAPMWNRNIVAAAVALAQEAF